MSRGSKKDPRFATRCFGAEEKTARNNAWRLRKRLCSFSGPHCGAEKSWRSKKRRAAAENKMDQSRGLEKDISGSKKRAAPCILCVHRHHLLHAHHGRTMHRHGIIDGSMGIEGMPPIMPCSKDEEAAAIAPPVMFLCDFLNGPQIPTGSDCMSDGLLSEKSRFLTSSGRASGVVNFAMCMDEPGVFLAADFKAAFEVLDRPQKCRWVREARYLHVLFQEGYRSPTGVLCGIRASHLHVPRQPGHFGQVIELCLGQDTRPLQSRKNRCPAAHVLFSQERTDVLQLLGALFPLLAVAMEHFLAECGEYAVLLTGREWRLLDCHHNLLDHVSRDDGGL